MSKRNSPRFLQTFVIAARTMPGPPIYGTWEGRASSRPGFCKNLRLKRKGGMRPQRSAWRLGEAKQDAAAFGQGEVCLGGADGRPDARKCIEAL